MAIQNITINFVKEDFARIRQAATVQGVSIHQFVLNAAKDEANAVLKAKV
jgi:uncharacterized protein (DUF1778 family)